MYDGYSLFGESPENLDITHMHKHCVPGLSSGDNTRHQ